MQRLRSVLFMPAANERALAKAADLPADGLILDLEDAVAPAAKCAARERACAVVSGTYGDRVVAIRVNGIGTEWHQDDVCAVAEAGATALVLPKVDSAEDVLAVEHSLESAGAPENVQVWVMLETPSGILRAAEIAAASERLAVLAIGTNDLIAEMRVQPTPGREPLLTALSMAVLAARATGRTVLDGVYNDVRDAAGFEAECQQGRRLGFDGKTLIHPSQLEICNRVFSPSESEIEYAHRVIETFENAARNGAGVTTLDDSLIERLHVQQAERVLALAARPSSSRVSGA